MRGKATDNSRPHSTSRQSRRKHENSFCGRGDTKGGKKMFDKGTQYKGKDDILRGNFARGSEKCPSILNPSYSKQSHHSDTFFQKNLGPKDIWSSEEGCGTDNIYPGSSSFNQHSGRKHPSFGSKSFNEDPFSKFLAQKIRYGAKSSLDGFEDCEPVGCSPSGSYISKTFALHESSIPSKPEFPPDSELRGIPSDSSLAAGSHGETQSLNLSAQESVSEDVKHKENLQLAKHEKFEGKNICIASEGLLRQDKLETDASSSKKIDCESREANVANPLLKDFVNTTFLPENTEETSPYAEIPRRFQTIDDEKEYVSQTSIYLFPVFMYSKFISPKETFARRLLRQLHKFDRDHHDAKIPPHYQKDCIGTFQLVSCNFLKQIYLSPLLLICSN